MNLEQLFFDQLSKADFADRLRRELSDQAIRKYCQIYASEICTGKLRSQNEAVLVRAFHGAAASQGVAIAQIGQVFAQATSQWMRFSTNSNGTP